MYHSIRLKRRLQQVPIYSHQW